MVVLNRKFGNMGSFISQINVKRVFIKKNCSIMLYMCCIKLSKCWILILFLVLKSSASTAYLFYNITKMLYIGFLFQNLQPLCWKDILNPLTIDDWWDPHQNPIKICLGRDFITFIMGAKTGCNKSILRLFLSLMDFPYMQAPFFPTDNVFL